MQYKNINVNMYHSSKANNSEVIGYASIFNVRDAQGDVVLPGAFQDVHQSLEKIKFLWKHDPKIEIGKWTNITEDERGLLVKGTLNIKSKTGMEVFLLIDQGACNGLSIGYRLIKSFIKGDTRYIEKLELHEISVVTFPSNAFTVVQNIANKYLNELESVYDSATIAFNSFKNMIKSFYKEDKDKN